MRFPVAAAAILTCVMTACSAFAFETTSVGGKSEGGAQLQDPADADPLTALTKPSSSSMSFGGFSVQTGTTDDNAAQTNWLNGPGSPGFGFTGSQSSSAGPASPFNTPILRERN
jgi:hypothetical protein